MLPWLSRWWPEIVTLAEKGGSSAAEVIDKVTRQHAFGLEVHPDSHLVVACAEDGALVVWLGVGRNARSWIGEAEAELRRQAARLDMTSLRIEGRKGWRRLLPHWEPVGEDLTLNLQGAENEK